MAMLRLRSSYCLWRFRRCGLRRRRWNRLDRNPRLGAWDGRRRLDALPVCADALSLAVGVLRATIGLRKHDAGRDNEQQHWWSPLTETDHNGNGIERQPRSKRGWLSF